MCTVKNEFKVDQLVVAAVNDDDKLDDVDTIILWSSLKVGRRIVDRIVEGTVMRILSITCTKMLVETLSNKQPLKGWVAASDVEPYEENER